MIRWRDLNALDDLLSASVSEIGRALDPSASSSQKREPVREPAASFPRLSLFECDAGFELLAPLPGVTADAIELTIERDALTIRGERRIADPEGTKCLRRERRRGAFAREVTLPAPIDAERVEAQMKDGILRVLLPKAAAARPRRIEVKSS